MKRNEAFDGLRGIAAIMVLLFHVGSWSRNPGVVPYGYLAVDLFFMLSGFVIAGAYEKKLAAGMSFAEYFFGVRVLRMYPMIALGSIIGLLASAIGAHVVPDPVLSFPRQMLMIPWPLEGSLYPYDGVLWSLLLELVVNAIHAALYPRLSTRYLMVWTAVAAVVLALTTFKFYNLNIGWSVQTAVWGVPRVMFSFPMGLLLYRLKDEGRLPALKAPIVVLLILTVALVAVPVATKHHLPPIHDALAVLIAFPVIVALAANVGLTEARGSAYEKLGQLSYPLYAIHRPLIYVLMFYLAARSMTHSETTAAWALFTAAVVVLAWLIDRLIEEPFQQWRKTRRQRAVAIK